MPYYSEAQQSATGIEQPRHTAAVAGGSGRPGAGTGCGLGVTEPVAAGAALEQMAAGIAGGTGLRAFQAGIETGQRVLGNRAVMRWVTALRDAGHEQESHSAGAADFPVPAGSCMQAAPLQLMLKKKKKQAGVPGEKEQAQAVAGAEPGTRLPEAQVKQAALPESGLSQAKPGATAEPVVKKKKKSRVQVALNTLRDEGVTAFREYIEAEIGEAELLRTLVERITRAENLEAVQAEALRVVEGRLRLHDPAAGSEPSHAVTPRQGEVMERPVKARFKAKLSKRERDLLEACMMGNAGRVRGLLRHGNVDINVGSEFGTFLCLAAYEGRAAVVRELLSRPGIDVNLATPGEVTPLYFAAQEGHVEIVELLLGVRAINVNLQNMYGETPLSVAAYEGREEVVKLLLAVKDVSVNVRGPDGATALFYAAQEGYPGIAELLLAAPGIDVNATGPRGATPLFVAAQDGHEEVVKLLLGAPKIGIDARVDDEATAVFVAAQNGFSGIVGLLIKHGADVNQPINDGTPPLSMSIINGHPETARLLLQAPGTQVNHRGLRQITPLCYASWKGHKDIVRLLLRKGADPNLSSDYGATPLHAASLYGHTAIVQMLLQAGAGLDAEVKGRVGEETIKLYTPYHLAELAGRREMMSVLAAHRRRTETAAARIEHLSIAEGPGGPSASTEMPEPGSAALRAGQAGTDPGMLPVASAEQAVEEMDTPGPATAGAVSSRPVPSGAAVSAASAPSPLMQAQGGLRKEVLRKLEQDNLEPLEGIRLLEDVNACPDLDSLCTLYNRLAGIERRKERARRQGRRHGRLSLAMGAPAAGPPAPLAPVFSLGARMGLDADTIEGEIKQRLEQRYHRFVGQAVNDMEFGRGKRTTGYGGLWHASSGVAGVGSCSVFYTSDDEAQRIRIMGIGHHVGRAAYRLDYADEVLGRVGQVLSIA